MNFITDGKDKEYTSWKDDILIRTEWVKRRIVWCRSVFPTAGYFIALTASFLLLFTYHGNRLTDAVRKTHLLSSRYQLLCRLRMEFFLPISLHDPQICCLNRILQISRKSVREAALYEWKKSLCIENISRLILRKLRYGFLM